MNRDQKKSQNRYFLPIMVVILTGFTTSFFDIGCKQKTSAETSNNIKQTQTEKPKQELKEPAKVIFESSIAGSWYPSDSNTLKKQIEGLFQKAESQPINNAKALILPHAGYQYSGQTAAAAIKSINKNYKRIIVIGPSHRTLMEDKLSITTATDYQSPLGQIPLDTEFINKLTESPLFKNVPDAQKYEHSVQIEIPLLQYKLGGFKLVPIVAGQCSPETINKASSIIKNLIDEDTLVIASSDFTHYGPSYGYMPFKENIPEQLKQLDMGAYKYIEQLDGKGFLEYREKTGATICGYIPIAILLAMMDKPTDVHLIKYATSGQLLGDYSNSVSYFGIVFSGNWKSSTSAEEGGLSEKEKKELLRLARQTIVYYLKNKKVPEPQELDVIIDEKMKEQRAAFVTLKEHSLLRGCIGDIFPRQPLYKSVINNAINASVRDRRFLPVSIAECNNITIEISALTIPQPVNSPDKIRIGTDGIVLSKGERSAVFLPQVATEQGWGLQETLSNLSMKAGLPADAWKENAAFQVFEAEVFGEEK